MTLAGYETIVESANGFGSRKALQSELGKEEKHSEVQELQDEVDSFKKQIQVLKVTFKVQLFRTNKILVLEILLKLYFRLILKQ